MKCSVVNCNKSNKGKSSACSFFRFPPDGPLRRKWIIFSGRKICSPNTSLICMHHFKAEDFENNLQYEMGFAKKRLLKDGVVPTIRIGDERQNDEQRALRIERRENKKTVNLLLQNHSSGLMPSQENEILQSAENIETAIENIDIKIENIDEVGKYQSEKHSEEIPSPDVSRFHNPNLNLEGLVNELLFLRKEKNKNDAALKRMKDKMEKLDEMHKKHKKQMENCLAKTKFELSCIEEKLQVIFTKGQIRKLKNGIKRQTWSKDDIAHSIALYDVSPKMYRLLYRNQFPFPSVRTLQSWAQKCQVTRGLVKPELEILEVLEPNGNLN